jgi:hypothetical protein
LETQKTASATAPKSQTAASQQVEVDLEAWYLVPEIEPEPQTSQFWLMNQKAGIPEENIITELPLDRLHSRSSVYVLCRKPYRGRHGYGIRPHLPITSVVDGERLHTPVALEELADDMRAYGPIAVKDHWSAGTNKFNSKLNRSSFLEALGAIAVPWSLKWKDMTRKDGDLPTILYLTSV